MGRVQEVRHDDEKANLATQGRDVEAAIVSGLNAGVQNNLIALSQMSGECSWSNTSIMGTR